MASTKSRKPRVALIGSDTLRGKEIASVLAAKKFPVASFELFDPDVEEEYSKLSQFGDEAKVVHGLSPAALEGLDLVFLAADVATNRRYGSLAAEKDYQAVDLGETFNADEKIPLVVAGINDAGLGRARPALVANPHPAAIMLAHILATLRTGFGVARAVAVVLEPASAYAEEGIQELAEQSTALLGGGSACQHVFQASLAFNLLAHSSRAERKDAVPLEIRLAGEVRRVLGPASPPLSVSVILAPVFHTYSTMAHVELNRAAAVADLKARFKANDIFKLAAPGDEARVSPTAVAGKDRIHLGEIKKDPTLEKSFWIWAIADNLTVGSALNAYGIARALVGEA
ncbi:MAG TPA: Asd/ArgC dimerization domain-containing protein [Acidobacteriota bacterium]|nr:Asd/ArgC dimerization domain-containing protein [Acidobacteriota bacterium]